VAELTLTQEALPARRRDRPRNRVVVFLRNVRRSHHALAGLSTLVVLILLVLVGPLLMPYSPTDIILDDQFLAPSWQHPFGTDEFGRDILTRVLYGGRISLTVGLLATALALVTGTIIGLTAGFYGGWFDLVSQRLVDVMLAFPGLLLALAIIAILGPGLRNVLLALAIGGIPYYARLVRGQVLSLRSREYVEAARVSGSTNGRLMFRHILPNTLSPLIVIGSLDLAGNILAASGLSFLGLGAQPPTPEWGAMLSSGRDFMRDQWWIATFPGLAIMVAVLAFNLLGDGLRDIFDPRGLD
jgi:peptide/nickel transport system permease protein